MECVMKRVALSIVFSVFLITGLSYAQTEEGAYLNIDYLKVAAEDVPQFEKFVSETWMEMLDKEVASGKMTGAYFYKVIYPGGSMSNYNYVLVQTCQSLSDLITYRESLAAKKATRKDDFMKRSLDLSTLQYSELWKTEAGIMDPNDKSISKYMVMNYMRVKPGMENQYLALENDIARPLHEERVKEGKMHNWRTYSIMKPTGVEYDYNFATADYYDSIANIEFGFTNEIMNSVMPGTNFTETMNAINDTRDIVVSELWVLFHHREK